MLTLLNPFTWLRSFKQFIASWFLSFPWSQIPHLIPALFLMVLLSIFGFLSWSDSDWRTSWLNKQYQVAVDEENYDTAELVVRRQLRRRPGDAELVFRLASLMQVQENLPEATRLMRELVRIKSHPGAAQWLLQNEFALSKWSESTAEQRKEFGTILELLVKEEPDNQAFKQSYVKYLFASGKRAAAIPVLIDLARFQPMRGLQAASLARLMGDDLSAERYANQTLQLMLQLAEEEPNNLEVAIALAETQLFLKKYPEAVETLKTRIERARKKEHHQRLSMALGDAMVVWVISIEKAPQKNERDPQRILQMLQFALNASPNNPRVIKLVLDKVLATLDQTDQQTLALREALINGTSPGIAHFIRGTAALMNKDYERAEKSLRMAESEIPKSGDILNNLAHAMSLAQNPDLESALAISNQAIDMKPKATPLFYQTRGQILFLLERHLDAIPDLEKALQVKTLAPEAHKKLAICYEKIGEPDIAASHHQAIENP